MKSYRFYLTIILFAGISFVANAQTDYTSSVGIRFGYPLSASYKQFITEKGAIEGYLGFAGFTGYSWVNIGALYQHHLPIESVNGLSWYFGGGAGLYFYSWKSGYYGDTSSSFSFGILGNIGLDYKFENAPVNLSLDWIPTIFIGASSGFGGGYGALAVRYVLK